jgi:hypothetical protein
VTSQDLIRRKLRLPTLSKGQAIIARHQLAELANGNTEPSLEDVHNRLNRHERRVVASEAREHRKQLAKRDARRALRAEKKNARALGEL